MKGWLTVKEAEEDEEDEFLGVISDEDGEVKVLSRLEESSYDPPPLSSGRGDKEDEE